MPATPPAIRRLCLAVDVESYSRRHRAEQIDVQNRLLWTLAQACRSANINPARCDRQDSGDGQILILPPGIDEGTAVSGIILGMLTGLRRVNRPVGLGGRVRLRISLGQGAIQIGPTGFVAPSVITVCRLLDCDNLRDALTASPTSDAVVIVTSDLYHDLFAEGSGGLPAHRFRRVFVRKERKGFAAEGWIQVPEGTRDLVTIPAYSQTADLNGRQIRGSVLLDLGTAAAVAWAVFAGIRHGHHDDSGHPVDHHGDGHTADHRADDHATENHGDGHMAEHHGVTHVTAGHGDDDHATSWHDVADPEEHGGHHVAADHDDHQPVAHLGHDTDLDVHDYLLAGDTDPVGADDYEAPSSDPDYADPGTAEYEGSHSDLTDHSDSDIAHFGTY
jgi:hypothetical protein